MKQVLMKISGILWQVPNSNETTIASIINPIETAEQANKMLKYLQKNKQNLKIGYLIKHKIEIIENQKIVLFLLMNKEENYINNNNIFFKDIKFVDEKGNLITVYHTMTNFGQQFNEFNYVGTDYYRLVLKQLITIPMIKKSIQKLLLQDLMRRIINCTRRIKNQ